MDATRGRACYGEQTPDGEFSGKNTENSDIGSPGTSDIRNRPLWVLCRRWREIYPNFLSWQKSVLLDLRAFSERNVNSSRPYGA